MSPEDLNNRFDYHAPDDARKRDHEDVRQTVKVAASNLNAMLPECREKSLVMTHLEEAMFWANAAIARQQ